MRFVRIGTLVKELGLSADTWRRLGDTGKVKCSKINGQRVFDFDSCERLLENGEAYDPVKQFTDITFRERNRRFREEMNRRFADGRKEGKQTNDI